MDDFLWLTNVENSEPVGLSRRRITIIEQKAAAEGHVVAVHLDTGMEIRVIESLGVVRRKLNGMRAESAEIHRLPPGD